MALLSYAGGRAMTYERSEPMTEQSQRDHDERWLAMLHNECNCGSSKKCNDKLRALLASIRAFNMSNASVESRTQLRKAIDRARRTWQKASSKHSQRGAAACNHELMPRVLLPRLRYYIGHTSDAYPYVPLSVVNDVRAMRYIRGHHNSCSKDWQILQARLQQYGSTGKGSIAEAIVVNDCYWQNEKAHAVPCGNTSQAAKRRHADRRAAAHDSSSDD
jgi:hypothetical protein